MNYFLWTIAALIVVALGFYVRSLIEKIPFLESARLTGILIGKWILSNLQKYVEPFIKTKLAQVVGTGLLAYFLGFGTAAVTDTHGQEIEDYKQKAGHLDSLWSVSELHAYLRDRDAQAAIAKLGVKITQLQDSMARVGNKLTQLSVGKGQIAIPGSAWLVQDSTFHDNFIQGKVKQESGRLKVDYVFNFEVGDVTATFTQVDGKKIEAYKVTVRSLVDPADVRYIGGYTRTTALQIDQVVVGDVNPWHWSDWTLSGHIVILPHFEAGLSISPFTWSSGGLAPNDVIARLPKIGLSTNLTGVHVFGAVGVNVGHWLPLLSDTYIDIGYAFGSDNGIFASFSTTL